MSDQPGDPKCICNGTGLVCKLGEDLRPDPASIEVCDCVVPQARKQRDEELRERLLGSNSLWRASGRLPGSEDDSTEEIAREVIEAALDSIFSDPTQ